MTNSDFITQANLITYKIAVAEAARNRKPYDVYQTEIFLQ